MSNQPIYYCDHFRKRMCGNSPWCVANGGPCESTTEKEFARRDAYGRLIRNYEMEIERRKEMMANDHS